MLTGVELLGRLAMLVASAPPTLTKKPKTSFIVSLLAACKVQETAVPHTVSHNPFQLNGRTVSPLWHQKLLDVR
jgi:hypothetical protein